MLAVSMISSAALIVSRIFRSLLFLVLVKELSQENLLLYSAYTILLIVVVIVPQVFSQKLVNKKNSQNLSESEMIGLSGPQAWSLVVMQMEP